MATCLLALVIAYLTLSPPDPGARDVVNDKLAHVLAFGALVSPVALLHKRDLIWLLPLAAVFGAAIEVIQPLVGRSGSVDDLIADLLGLTLGAILGVWMGHRQWPQALSRATVANDREISLFE